LEKTSAKEGSNKIGFKSEKKLISERRRSKKDPLFTLTKFEEIAS
jgi:hypothetical protein